MEHLLKQRVRYFLTSRYRGRSIVHSAISELANLGPIVLIGGMLRDLALHGNRPFNSDLDFVIDPINLELFEQKMYFMGGKLNRFGGYSLVVGRWRLDIWPLQRTWAKVSGNVSINSFEDLKKATFFSSDSIIYNICTSRISSAPEYYDNLERRFLEINLQPNPNPHGNVVRAFRYAMLKGFRWGPKLTRFVNDTISEVGWDYLAHREQQSYKTSFVALLKRHSCEKALCDHVLTSSAEPFTPLPYLNSKQLELFLMQQQVQLSLPINHPNNSPH